MNTSVQNEKKAVELRREGKSYSDIAKLLKVSRASVCNWVKKVRLTDAERQLLQKNIEAKKGRARMMAAMTIRTRKVYKEKVAYDTAEIELKKMSKDPFFMLGLGMLGLETMKNRMAFTFCTPNQDSMALMLKWLHKYLGISQKTVKIRVIKTKIGESRSITVSKMALVRRIIAWQKLTMLYYS